jgi:hypothetical protein
MSSSKVLYITFIFSLKIVQRRWAALLSVPLNFYFDSLTEDIIDNCYNCHFNELNICLSIIYSIFIASFRLNS